MRKQVCMLLSPRLPFWGCTPRIPYRSSYSANRGPTRLQSYHAQSRTTEDTLAPRIHPFVVERVGGRECHISWSEGGIQKEWCDPLSTRPVSGQVVVRRNSWTGRMSSWLRQMFLPTNYPHSVHRSYLPFHVLQFAETTLATITSVLCNQALLTSVGVSAEGSILGAVAIQWIIKDGAGEVAKLFFIRHFSPYFDSHPKAFTLFGEVIGCLGSGLQIATLLIAPSPGNFLICAAGGNIFKLVGNAIWFTTHIKFVRYFSEQGNTGDVAAKDESQASIAQLTGYASGISLLTFSHTAAYLYTIFSVAVPLHLMMTACMMRVATFELLTLPRISCLAQEYVTRGRVSSLTELDQSGCTGLFGEFYQNKGDRWLTLAPRVSEVLEPGTENQRSLWQICAAVFRDGRYLLFPLQSPRGPVISVFFHPDATNDDMLRSILHAALIRNALLQRQPPLKGGADNRQDTEILETYSNAALRSTLVDTRLWAENNFGPFKETLEARGWRTDELCYADHGHRVLWTPGD
ncbi:DUF647-domain-containing protein [Trametes punicea]|nr:DUF647-domain-containing protein [Trametes punicea]